MVFLIVRDAAARLPNGEGTRAEICELLKDSQFLAPDVTSAQVGNILPFFFFFLTYSDRHFCVDLKLTCVTACFQWQMLFVFFLFILFVCK